jgi:prevent-host-death family protein
MFCSWPENFGASFAISAILANTPFRSEGAGVKALTAKDAKYGFGRLIDLARTEPVVVEKHGRPVVVVMAVEEFERLKQLEAPFAARGRRKKGSKSAA